MTPLSDSEAATVQRFENAEPAPESWGGGLRSALTEAYAKWAEAPFEPAEWQRENGRQLAEILLALPELTALRAKADAADRVRAVLDEVEDRSTNIRDLDAVDRLVLGSQRAAVHQIRAALGGPSC